MKFDVVNFTKEADSLREGSGDLSLQCRLTQCSCRSGQLVERNMSAGVSKDCTLFIFIKERLV